MLEFLQNNWIFFLIAWLILTIVGMWTFFWNGRKISRFESSFVWMIVPIIFMLFAATTFVLAAIGIAIDIFELVNK